MAVYIFNNFRRRIKAFYFYRTGLYVLLNLTFMISMARIFPRMKIDVNDKSIDS